MRVIAVVEATALALLTPVTLPIRAVAQPIPPPTASRPTPVRTVLASAGLPSVGDVPLHFKLLRVSVAAGQSTQYVGSNGFVWGLSGVLMLTTDEESRTLRGGDAAFIGAGKRASLQSTGGDAAVFLHFLLVAAGDLGRSAESEPATVTELYRTATPIPGLKPGAAYEFSLTRVTLPPRTPINPPHYRSGGALYYVAAGRGAFTTGGGTEPRPAGVWHYEPYGMVHQWANPGDVPLVLLQANISPEGTPVVIFGTPSETPK
jgi:quercetin dioxygenase-like cupin family protein